MPKTLPMLRTGLLSGLLCFSVATAQNPLNVTGTVYAVPNSTVQGTVVIACLIENGTCSTTRSLYHQVTGNGKSSAFQVAGLQKTPYLLLAWRDVNGNTSIDAGDEVAVYTPGGKADLLTPPASKIELRLQSFNGDLDALLANGTAQAQTTTKPATTTKPSPASSLNASALRGEFSSVSASVTQYFNANTGSALPVSGNGTSFVFGSDGTVEQYSLIQNTFYDCTSSIAVYRTGVFQVKGSTLTMNFKKGSSTLRDSCAGGASKTVPARFGLDVFQWRLYVDPDTQYLVLELTDKDGKIANYTQRKP